MQQYKRGNPRRRSRKRNEQRVTITVPQLEVARLYLYDSDPVTGREDALYTLFYEFYRGYTIYSTEQGQCSVHGKEGCLRIQGKYVCFPAIEQAKNLMKHFQADGRTPAESMHRYVPEDEYICLNRSRQKDNSSKR